MLIKAEALLELVNQLAISKNGKFFTLYDVLGVDKELGFTMHTDKYNWEAEENHFITEQLEHETGGMH